MRKSFDGLFGIIKSDLNRDVRDGGLFMFLNQRLNHPRKEQQNNHLFTHPKYYPK